MSINYTKSFNVKNTVINAIEKKEGYQIGDISTDVNDQLVTYGYISLNENNRSQYLNACKNAFGEWSSDNQWTLGYDANTTTSRGYAYCVLRICSGGTSYYKVVSFASIEIPIIAFDIKIPISGETKALYCDVNDANCTRTTNCSVANAMH